MRRWVYFLVAILVGLAVGLYYGWVISPVQYVDTAPDTLREDYQVDYVLMVAEAYQVEDDLARAVRRLALLGGDLPEEIVGDAIAGARALGYTDEDLALMETLRDDLLTWNPSLEGPPR